VAPEAVRWEGEEPNLNLVGRGAQVHGVKEVIEFQMCHGLRETILIIVFGHINY
jgi:hypothetical protein